MYGHIWKPLQRMYQNEIAAELQGVPDLIIDNYSDGNLVASLLSYKLGITQCNIAHALEKQNIQSLIYIGENLRISTISQANLLLI